MSRKVLTKFYLRNNEKGFTLVEFITTMFVFSVMAIIVAGIWVKAVQIERRDFSAQIIEENTLAVLDTMAKEIRVSTITNQDNNCSAAPSASLTMTFNDSLGGSGTLVYSLVGGVVQRTYGGVTYQMSSNDIVFNSLGFCVSGSSTSPYGNDATRVTIIASISNTTGNIVTVNTQTAVTIRDVSAEVQN